MIAVPQSTPEKPLTAIDYIATLDQAKTAQEVRAYDEQVPLEVRHDWRFIRAVDKKLIEIEDNQRSQGRAA